MSYDVRAVLECLLDEGRLDEFQPEIAPEMIGPQRMEKGRRHIAREKVDSVRVVRLPQPAQAEKRCGERAQSEARAHECLGSSRRIQKASNPLMISIQAATTIT